MARKTIKKIKAKAKDVKKKLTDVFTLPHRKLIKALKGKK